MTRYIHKSKKLKLARLGRQTRWAPYWTVPKMYGEGRRVHPGRHTAVKRSWRRNSSKI